MNDKVLGYLNPRDFDFRWKVPKYLSAYTIVTHEEYTREYDRIYGHDPYMDGSGIMDSLRRPIVSLQYLQRHCGAPLDMRV